MKLLLFHNVKHSSELVNLRVGIYGIPVTSVPRATVSTLKPKKPKRPENLFFKKP